MCGIIAICTCPKALPNHDIHGHVIGHTKPQANGHANGHTNGHANGHTNGHANGHTNGHANGHTNGHANGHANGTATNGHVNSAKPALGSKAVEISRQKLAVQLEAAVDVIKHRGPDGTGVWVSDDARVGMGHCRLSINDLSASGAQPLHSDDGTIHAVVNGEIYDHDRLRQVCATEHGYRFTGESDSELVIALYRIHGAPGFLEHLRGEYAFVLFDSREGSRRVIAGRDRFGIKPLVWTVLGDKVLFAAEAKAFLPMGWKPEWNVRAITDSGWMMDDRTVFKGVRKLMPGHWMEITDEEGVEIHKYWDAEYPDKVRCSRTNEMIPGADSSLFHTDQAGPSLTRGHGPWCP
jgi:asparagine synthase (glutamine-hydrolysing)